MWSGRTTRDDGYGDEGATKSARSVLSPGAQRPDELFAKRQRVNPALDGVASSLLQQAAHKRRDPMAWTPVLYKAKDYSTLKGLHGISDDQVAVHLTLYNGYVTRSNKLAETLASMNNDGKVGTPEYNE